MTNKIIKRNGCFWTGVTVIAIIILSYFIKIRIDSGGNYNTYDSILGIIIFHNPFILGIYILVAVVLIAKGLKK